MNSEDPDQTLLSALVQPMSHKEGIGLKWVNRCYNEHIHAAGPWQSAYELSVRTFSRVSFALR